MKVRDYVTISTVMFSGVGAISATFVARNGSLVTRAGILLLFKPDTISNE